MILVINVFKVIKDLIILFVNCFNTITGIEQNGKLVKKPLVPENVELRNNIVPKSVNYHFTRQCNYSCGFCFHTAKTSYVLPLEVAKSGLKLLKDAG